MQPDPTQGKIKAQVISPKFNSYPFNTWRSLNWGQDQVLGFCSFSMCLCLQKGKKNSVFGLEPSQVLKMDSLKKKKEKEKEVLFLGPIGLQGMDLPNPKKRTKKKR